MSIRTGARLVLAGVALLGCGVPPPPTTKPDPYAAYRDVPPERLAGGKLAARIHLPVVPRGRESCFETASVQSYMREVRRRVYGRWKLPAGIPGDREVHVRFRLRADGAVESVASESAGQDPLAQSALAAVRGAAPFPAPPECVVGELSAYFRNPSQQVETAR